MTSTEQLAERALFGLAADLRFVPLDERTRGIHLRTLALKRMVRGWEARPPDEREAEAVLEELQQLAVDARRYRDEMRGAIGRLRAPGCARASSPSRSPRCP